MDVFLHKRRRLGESYDFDKGIVIGAVDLNATSTSFPSPKEVGCTTGKENSEMDLQINIMAQMHRLMTLFPNNQVSALSSSDGTKIWHNSSSHALSRFQNRNVSALLDE
jgi:hypothetical protein